MRRAVVEGFGGHDDFFDRVDLAEFLEHLEHGGRALAERDVDHLDMVGAREARIGDDQQITVTLACEGRVDVAIEKTDLFHFAALYVVASCTALWEFHEVLKFW